MIWKISKSSHFKLLIKCFQAIVIKLQGEKFFKVALLSYKKMALLALFKTNHTGPSSTGSLGLHQISADIGSPVCSLPKSWDINKPNLFPQITLVDGSAAAANGGKWWNEEIVENAEKMTIKFIMGFLFIRLFLRIISGCAVTHNFFDAYRSRNTF